MKLRGKQSFLASVGVTLVGNVWSTLLALLTIPIMVNSLGFASYGIYSVAFSIAALGSYLDLGLGWSTTKFVAEADAAAASRRVATAVMASMAYHLVVGVIFATVLIGLADWISTIALRVQGDEHNAARSVVHLTAVSFVVSSLSGVLISALRGVRRFALATLISSGATTISVAGAAAAVALGFGIVYAAAAQLFGTVCGLAASLIVCKSFLRDWDRGELFWAQLRQMLVFSMWNYVTRLYQMLALQADKIAIAHWSGPAALAFYTVPFNFSQRVNFLAGPAVTAIYPIAAAGQQDREAFIRQYLAGSRLMHVATAAIAISILVWGDRFLGAWVNAEMGEHGAFFLTVLTIGFWAVSVGSFDGSCIEGWNRPQITCAISTVAVAAGLGVIASAWAPMGATKAVALGVMTYFIVAGVGQSLVWYRIARYPALFMLYRVIFPVCEMAVLGSMTALALRSHIEGRVASIIALVCLVLALGIYGVLRAFSVAELRALRERVVGTLRSA